MAGNQDSYDDVPGSPGDSLARECRCCSSETGGPSCPTVGFEARIGLGTKTHDPDPEVPFLTEEELREGAQTESDDELASADWEPVVDVVTRRRVSDNPDVTPDAYDLAEVLQEEYRWRLVGGNTGYVRVDWRIVDMEDVEITSGTMEHEWDTDDPLDDTVEGEVMPVPEWPELDPDTGIGIAQYVLRITEITCIRPEEP